MKKDSEPMPDWVFALIIAGITTFLMGGVIFAGFKILTMLGFGR